MWVLRATRLAHGAHPRLVIWEMSFEVAKAVQVLTETICPSFLGGLGLRDHLPLPSSPWTDGSVHRLQQQVGLDMASQVLRRRGPCPAPDPFSCPQSLG